MLSYLIVIVLAILVWEYVRKSKLGEQLPNTLNRFFGKRKCYNCHLYVSKKSKFCSYCGSKL